jgi:hypothetical protein
LKRFATAGEEITVAAQVGLYGEVLGVGNYSVSQNGTLVYDASELLTRFEWFDRGGKQLSTVGEPGPRFAPRISPDGSRIAFVQEDAGTQTSQIWIGDLARGIQTRLSGESGTGPNFLSGPVWSPDGLRIAHQSDIKHQADVYVRDLSTGAEVALTDEDGQHIPQDWSSDGRYIVYSDREPADRRIMQVSVVPADGSGKPFVLLPRSPKDYGRVRFSPDSRWVAFDLDESGRREIYAVSFPDGRQKVQLSDRGGYAAKWVRGGKEVLYLSYDNMVMSVAIDTSRGLVAALPKPLFRFPEGAGFGWDVTADGERFIVNVPVIKSSSVPLSVVVDWTTGLKKK